MLLLITDSKDGLSNELALLIGEQAFFRFNVDLWYNYDIEINNEYWLIKDPIGREIKSNQNRNVLIRKPFQTFFSDAVFPSNIQDNQKHWTLNQVQQTVYELCLIEKSKGNIKLIDFHQPFYLGKSVQMIFGAKYFNVPKWKIFWSSSNYKVEDNYCVKSLQSSAFSDGTFLFTKGIENNSYLEKNYPWFIQKKIDAEFDLTVLYINGECFAFTLNRSQINDLDWRKEIFSKDLNWNFTVISTELTNYIKQFMTDMNLKFGRLDFLIDHEDNYWFLEVNDNGEWGWLDEFFEFGLYESFLAQFGIKNINTFLRKRNT